MKSQNVLAKTQVLLDCSWLDTVSLKPRIIVVVHACCNCVVLLMAIKPSFVWFFLRTAPKAHILPLRRFMENVVDSDLRSFFASSCFKVNFTFNVG